MAAWHISILCDLSDELAEERQVRSERIKSDMCRQTATSGEQPGS